MRWTLDENKGDILYETIGDRLILKVKPNIIANGSGHGEGDFYHIKSEETTIPTDQNAFTALRVLKEIKESKGDWLAEAKEMFLRKDIPDTASRDISFSENIQSTVFLDGWDGEGWRVTQTGGALFDSACVRSDVFLAGKFGSPSFTPGFTGWGTEIDIPSATGTFDNLFARKNFTAYTITYSQIYGLGGSQIVSDINKIARVETLSDRFRCYMDSMDGLMLMNLRPGDGARIQTRTGTTSIKYLFGRVIDVATDYFDIALPLIEGSGEPEIGDFVLRWGNDRDDTRQGLIYLTSADQGAPFIAVYDGITEVSTQDKLKVLVGNLSDVRTTQGVQLHGYGGYFNGVYIENSSVYLNNGMTVEQQFSVMNGEFNSKIEGIKNDMSLEQGNILRNSSFSENLHYWDSEDEVHLIDVNSTFLWMDGSFYSEKVKIADVYRDGNRNVLRILGTTIRQQNQYFTSAPVEGIYSFSLFYKVRKPGILTMGFTGSQLHLTQYLESSTSYQKLSNVGQWDGKGDFEIGFTGEILIYGVSLFNDALADANIKLQTQITQNAEKIALTATKDYVDTKTGEIYIHYDSELSVTAEQISAVSTKVDNINDTIETSGWITEADGNTLFAGKQLEDGDTIINYINQTATTTTISSIRIDLYGVVSYSFLDPGLKNTINGKLESENMGALAWRDTVSSSYLDSNLQEKIRSIADKVNYDTLNHYTVKGTISKADLTDALQSELTGKMNGSVKLNGNATKLADVIINGKTLIAGGFIQSEYLNVNHIDAVTGTIAGFNITSYELASSDGSRIFTIGSGGVVSIDPSHEGLLMEVAPSKGRGVLIDVGQNATIGLEIQAHINTTTALYSTGNVKFDLGWIGRRFNMQFYGVPDNANTSTFYDGRLCVYRSNGYNLLMIK